MDDAVFGLYVDKLSNTAKLFKTPGKNIRAIDESISTVKLPCWEDNVDLRRAYRELLLTTPGALSSLIGVVLSEEALHQKTADGKPFTDVLKENEVLVGIMTRGNPVAWRGPDGHTQKFQQHREAGAHFAVWDDGPVIDASEPSETTIRKQAEELASFATYCQRGGLVPIVYPKLSFDKTPSTGKFADSTKSVLAACLKALNDRNVHLEGILLMLGIAPQADPRDIARDTLNVLRKTVPPAIPVIVFLSSGQSENEAVITMNNLKVSKVSKPWSLSSFFGPPPQQRTLKARARNSSPHSLQDTRRAQKRPRDLTRATFNLVRALASLLITRTTSTECVDLGFASLTSVTA
ncbi:fructose-bisphosphate aldolase 5, cytosolic-like [Eucalyptus grandis]|uniref:fructose-bisphosphate aldolase 5, cytosolic-like n=1 Tax=Eucalyptus grandis TaxID=71139 RepID=UPI00192ECE60|nr:fructose-bisphosphate aldolase 5, cytosolic-like [Eucalyptus grandis]